MPVARPEVLVLDRLATPIGELLAATDEDGVLRAVDWQDYEPRMRRLMAMIEHRRVDLSSLVTHRFSLDQMNDALDVLRSGKAIRVVVTP